MAEDLLCSPWITGDDLCAAYSDLPPGEELANDAVQLATEVLYNLTRRRWPGVCTDVIRPCRRRCVVSGSCSCGALSEVALPGRPVVEVSEVLVDGDVVPTDEYEVGDRKNLVGLRKADGRLRVWPSCQRMDLPTTERFTWQVSYSYGAEPPPGGIRAVKSLAYQLALAFTPNDMREKCRLPKRVTAITRQGVTIAVMDPLTLFEKGLTGLAEVDLWVTSVNRGSDTRSAVVVDPMRHQAARRSS